MGARRIRCREEIVFVGIKCKKRVPKKTPSNNCNIKLMRRCGDLFDDFSCQRVGVNQF